MTLIVIEEDCVFPFTYLGKTYNKCTKDHSENGKSWCAYEVNHDGVAVDGKWEDCNPGCPGVGKLPLEWPDFWSRVKHIEKTTKSEFWNRNHTLDFQS